MKIGYTEFSFGYAFTENLIRAASSNPVGAPVFPNLKQEAQLGYDVRINFPGCPLFLQYKLPELMVRKSAAEISEYSLQGINIPFFRMSLIKRNLSKQHELLIKLEDQSPNTVYYAAPNMCNVDTFNDAYNSAKVHCQSVFFSPKSIGPLSDDQQHVIAYRNGLNYAWLRSEPRKIPALQFENISRQLRRSFEDPRYLTLQATASNIREEILPLVSPWIQDSEDAIRQHIRARRTTLRAQNAQFEIGDSTTRVVEDLLVYREIACVGLGLDLIIAQPPG